MAHYGYTNRGFMPQETNKYGARFEPSGARNNGLEPHSNGWGKTGFSTPDETPRDHVCKPVIIDADGRKRPLVAYSPNNNIDNCVTKIETIVERVHVPEVNSYGNVSPTKMGDRKGYGGLNHGWNRPKTPTYERPQVVFEEIVTHVQTEPTRPSKTNLVSSMLWRKKPHSHGHDGGTHGYSSDVHQYGNSAQPQHFDAYKEEPTVITDGGWARPSRAGWAAPSTPITKPTNDIGTAIDYLKDTAMSHSVTTAPAQRRFMVPPAMVPRVETYDSPTMDSRDALRRYGPPQPATSPVYSSGAMDSREALRRYHGQMM